MASAVRTGVIAPTNPGGAIREDLINFITTIAREETPFYSSIGSTTASNVIHEWLTDDLATPVDNAHNEGAAYAAGNVVFNTRVRKNNYCQIFRKELGVSGTAEMTDQAGVGAGEYAYQLKKNAMELKRDIERQFVRFQGTGAPTQSVRNGADPRRAGSIFTWTDTIYRAPATGNIAPVPLSGTAGTNLTFTNSVATPSDDDINGTNLFRGTLTPVNITRGHIEGILAAMYEKGAKPNMAMTSPVLKTGLSQLFSDANASTGAQRRMTSMEMKLNIAVTAVMTDFGFDLALVPNYQMGGGALSAGYDNAVLFYESDKVNKAVLRPFQEKQLDDQGDGRRGILICEETLEVRNPKAVGSLVGVM